MREWFITAAAYVVVSLLIALPFMTRGSCANEQTAVRSLETQGYSDIEVIDHSWFVVGLRGCDGKDAARFTVNATNPSGNQVEVFVCVGWPFKGATIRTD